MSIVKTIRLGLLHVAVAITFVTINGVLNRVMIFDLGILASVVAVLVVLPYLLSPLQVLIGQYSDTHPWRGYRRTPYIALGLLLCVGGALLTPFAALMIGRGGNWLLGLPLAVLAFGLWGFGYNLAVVSYLSLASDLSPESQRSRTIAIMWFMMIASIIVTAVLISKSIQPYSDAQLIKVFGYSSIVALGLAALGLVGLEPRLASGQTPPQSRTSQREALRAVLDNPQARIFFLYLILLLSAILGQDILLEPFGAQAFGMSVAETTQLTPVWGGMTLLALLLYGLLLNRWMSKRQGAFIGGFLAALGLFLIAASGLLALRPLFVPGVAILGFGTGIATSTNLGLMLDMTTPEQVGLFIGAWGTADALARGLGTLLGGALRDAVSLTTGSASGGYITVFMVEALLLCGSLLLLRQINVASFRSEQPRLSELVALAADA